jgi:tripartite-type tricarboxylate transporter receptor subunit TctC
MKLMLRSTTLVMLLLAACAGTHDVMTKAPTSRAASAQDYPASPVHIIEPFGAGGGPDLLARALAPKLSELWGQPVTVENHPGVSATLGPAAAPSRSVSPYSGRPR